MKKSLITGVTGQDGAYLASFLLGKGYSVVGTHRGQEPKNLWRLKHLGVLNHPHFLLSENNLMDIEAIRSLLIRFDPKEVYHLAAPSSVAQSFLTPYETVHAISTSTLNLLESVRTTTPLTRFFLASSSEIFDFSTQALDERSQVHPRSPYAVGKLNAQWIAESYRESYGVFASVGILFNHESPLRSTQFVTKKICRGAVQIASGLLDCLELGNLNVQRDWGYAPEYVECMWRMLQAPAADTYVLASQKANSIRNFVLQAFCAIGVDLEFYGSSVDEVAVVRRVRPCRGLLARVTIGQTVVRVNPDYLRPADHPSTLGNATKAHAKLGWVAGTELNEVCSQMIDYELTSTLPL
jgi:GDPmannose 4,6-dehydratase